MSTEIKKYTITVFSENKVGILSRVVAIFTRRHINIESLTVSSSEIENVSRFIIVVEITEEQAEEYRKFESGEIEDPEWLEEMDWDDGDTHWSPANEVEVSISIKSEES